MDPRGLRIGRVVGVPVLLRPSWFLIAGTITWLFAPTVRDALPGIGAAGAHAVALAFAGLLLVSVFVHEVAHALAAGATGTPATHIVLDLWGGHTAFDEASRTPGRSALVAVVGPASNAVIAVVAAATARFLDPWGVMHLLVVATAASNAVVAVFNGLPGLPLDGGRVLEALVWRLTGDRLRGALAAAWCGRAVAAGVAVWALVVPLAQHEVTTALWLLLVAGLLWHGASGTLAAVAWQRRAPAVTVAGLLRPAVPVASDATVAAVMAAAGAAGVSDVVLLDLYGRPAALVDEAATATVPAARAALVPAAAVGRMLPPGAVLTDDLAGEHLLARLRMDPHDVYAVLGSRGDVVGVLSLDAVAEYVTAR